MVEKKVPFPVSFSRMQMIECPLALWKRMHNVPTTTPEPSFFTFAMNVMTLSTSTLRHWMLS